MRDPVPPVHDATWLQRSLNALGADPRLAEDGVYGRLTVAAVAQFQQQNSLSASGVADAATIAAIESKLRPTVPGPIPSGPTDLIALLERLVMLIEKLKGMRPMMDPSSGLSPTDRLRKTLDLLQAILSPARPARCSRSARSTARWGRRSAICSTARRPRSACLAQWPRRCCTKASETATLGPLLGALTPAIGLSGFALPVFLGLTAWGVLGKMEKWSHGTAPPPRT